MSQVAINHLRVVETSGFQRNKKSKQSHHSCLEVCHQHCEDLTQVLDFTSISRQVYGLNTFY